MKYGVKQLVCDYAVICEDTNLIMCVCNIRGNAKLIADILNADNANPRAYFYGIYPNAKYKVVMAEKIRGLVVDCSKCGFWDYDREGCTCPSPDKVYACPIVTGSLQKKKLEADNGNKD